MNVIIRHKYFSRLISNFLQQNENICEPNPKFKLISLLIIIIDKFWAMNFSKRTIKLIFQQNGLFVSFLYFIYFNAITSFVFQLDEIR